LLKEKNKILFISFCYDVSEVFFKKKLFMNAIVCARVMVLYAAFNNISAIPWWSVLLLEETGVT